MLGPSATSLGVQMETASKWKETEVERFGRTEGGWTNMCAEHDSIPTWMDIKVPASI